jgi:hypothetical protein
MNIAPPEPSARGTCPACGRYTGPALTCPYCEIELPDRTAFRLLRWTALLFASVGLLVLLLAAQRQPLPVTPVAQITGARTERIRVRGLAVTSPRIVSRDGIPRFISFDLDDGSGTITVAATREVARHLLAENRLPQKGDTIEVTGNPGADRNRQLRLYMDAPPASASPASTPPPEGAL